MVFLQRRSEASLTFTPQAERDLRALNPFLGFLVQAEDESGWDYVEVDVEVSVTLDKEFQELSCCCVFMKDADVELKVYRYGAISSSDVKASATFQQMKRIADSGAFAQRIQDVLDQAAALTLPDCTRVSNETECDDHIRSVGFDFDSELQMALGNYQGGFPPLGSDLQKGESQGEWMLGNFVLRELAESLGIPDEPSAYCGPEASRWFAINLQRLRQAANVIGWEALDAYENRVSFFKQAMGLNDLFGAPFPSNSISINIEAWAIIYAFYGLFPIREFVGKTRDNVASCGTQFPCFSTLTVCGMCFHQSVLYSIAYGSMARPALISLDTINDFSWLAKRVGDILSLTRRVGLPPLGQRLGLGGTDENWRLPQEDADAYRAGYGLAEDIGITIVNADLLEARLCEKLHAMDIDLQLEGNKGCGPCTDGLVVEPNHQDLVSNDNMRFLFNMFLKPEDVWRFESSFINAWR